MRHGRTEWNSSGRFQGRTDVSLSSEGRAQAQALSRSLRDEQLDAIYSSDLVRARETAAAIAKPHGVDVRLDERLREFDFGGWEGLTWDQIVARFPRAARSGRTSARDYAPDGGERFALVCDRVRAFLDDARSSSAARVLAVSHAGVLHAFADVIFGKRMDALGLFFAPASATRIAFDADEPRLVTLNDTTHLTQS